MVIITSPTRSTMSDGESEVVANFVAKLWKMLNNPEIADTMYWTESGKSFVIKNQITFIQRLLPMYFKHNNMGSFVRQLNLYDFHKICIDKHIDLEYHHKCFQRDRPDLLKFIKRKMPKYKRVVYTKVEHDEDVSDLSKDLSDIKGHQNEMSNRISSLQKENLTLLKELTNLHKKHNSQTQVMKKIIELLIPFANSYSNTMQRNNNDALRIDNVDPDLVKKLEAITQGEWGLFQSGTGDDSNMQLQSMQTSMMDMQFFKQQQQQQKSNPIVEEAESDDFESFHAPNTMNDALDSIGSDLNDFIDAEMFDYTTLPQTSGGMCPYTETKLEIFSDSDSS